MTRERVTSDRASRCVVDLGDVPIRDRTDASGGVSVPRPAVLAGLETFFLHGSTGHPTFLLGTPSNRGWWYYFPVALLGEDAVAAAARSRSSARSAPFADVRATATGARAVPFASRAHDSRDQH